MRIAVVGGGLAGACCAHELAVSGKDVTLFDMGARGPGGRASCRPAEGYCFDHGCQVLAPVDRQFQNLLSNWEARGIVTQWEGRVGTLEAAMGLFTPRHKTTADVGDGAPAGDEGDKHCESPDSSFCGSGFFGALQAAKLYVGAPGMNSICERLLAAEPNVTVETYCRVTRVDWDGEQRTWRLDGLRGQSLDHSKEGNTPYFLGTFDALVVADVMAGTPGTPGTLNIDQEYHPLEKHFSAMAGVPPGSLFSAMIALPRALEGVPFDAAVVKGSTDLQWICRDSSKPGRGRDDGHECWVVVSSADFALRMVQAMPLSIDGKYNPQTQVYLDSIAPKLLAAFQDCVASFLNNGENLQPTYLKAQRWGNAAPATSLELPHECIHDPELNFAACGDFCSPEFGAHGALRSGHAAANLI
ncbi:hypothetical protein CYMTET_10975 [Cymbomonas tetramitiformis]|uniref:Amine oxidase domain-containing protein n=1 Tax=Cymbomonas tetramitiformis TaxID=36881 RepID=A0AAE0GNI5_9CHLO|nr:hypothetical protein CYMTET_10975 [Cymbomonas tetramitiformis]